jgi:tripartite-type tricarboxylate transporter receptor subunit TctC
MDMNRRAVFVGALGLAATKSSSLLAQQFPSRFITFIVPFAPGGNIDIVARSVAVPFGKNLGQQTIVDNRGGGGGSIGAAAVARSPADGYTLLVGTPAQVVTLPEMFKTGYTRSDFRPVGLASKTSVIIVARADDPKLGSFEKFRSYAASRPKALTAAHSGVGTPNHLALLKLEDLLGVTFTIVPYRGSGPALTDLLGGQIDVHIDQVTSSMPHIVEGKLKALLVLGPERDPSLPDVPCAHELGLRGIDATTYAGLFAPAATPPQVMATLSSALQTSVADPNFVSNLKNLGSLAFAGNADRFGELMDAEASVAKQMVAQGRLKGD